MPLCRSFLFLLLLAGFLRSHGSECRRKDFFFPTVAEIQHALRDVQFLSMHPLVSIPVQLDASRRFASYINIQSEPTPLRPARMADKKHKVALQMCSAVAADAVVQRMSLRDKIIIATRQADANLAI